MTQSDWQRVRDEFANNPPDYEDNEGLSSRDRHIWKHAVSQTWTEARAHTIREILDSAEMKLIEEALNISCGNRCAVGINPCAAQDGLEALALLRKKMGES